LFGDEAHRLLEYVTNKCRGGKSNQKGGSYEGFFAVYQIALAYPLVKQELREVFIETQVDKAFVDDLMVEDRTQNQVKNFQLKNCDSNLTWNHSKNTNSYYLWEDFFWQNRINTELFKTSNIVLVLSSKTNFINREKTIPKEIQPFTEVCLFRSAKNLRELLKIEPSFRDAISEICVAPSSDGIRLETATNQILAVWLSQSGKVSIAEIMQQVLINAKNPTYIRTFDTEDIEMDREAHEILEGIGIIVKIAGGYLDLQYPDGMFSGKFRHPLGSDGFKKFEKWIKDKKPLSWDEIEVVVT